MVTTSAYNLPEVLTPSEAPWPIDYRPTMDAVRQFGGGVLLDRMGRVDPDTLVHELSVGEIARQIGVKSGLSEESCTSLCIAGGEHDTGKEKPDVQDQIRRPDDFGAKVRKWVREAHCRYGWVAITLDACIATDTRGARLHQERAAFTAYKHHTKPPTGYRNFEPELATRLGITHVVTAADILHAMWYDDSNRRAYKGQREGTRNIPPERVLAVIAEACGPKDPVIDGVIINLRAVLREHLGLKPESVAA